MYTGCAGPGIMYVLEVSGGWVAKFATVISAKVSNFVYIKRHGKIDNKTRTLCFFPVFNRCL